MNFPYNNQEWVIGIISAVVGAILTLITTVIWDNHKNKKRYNSLLRLLLSELKENQKRVNSVVEKLPADIRDSIEKGNINIDKGVFIPADQVSELNWTFPKPYTVDAWKTFISSGFATELPSELFQKIYKIYDSIDSINFLSNLSINIFQILAQPNRLDDQTNKNFDQFCRFGTSAVEIMLARDIGVVARDLETRVK